MALQTLATGFFLLCFLLFGIGRTVPIAKYSKPKSVSIFSPKAAVATALTSKIHKNAFLASAFHVPYAYAPMGGVGMGTGMASYSTYAGGIAAPHYSYGGYASVYPGVYSNNHQSYYSNHMGFPNGFSVNTKKAYVPSHYGYPVLGGQKTAYNKVNSHLGGATRESGVSYTGHDGFGQYNYGTHQKRVSLPGLTQVTYTHRYPVLPAFQMYGSYGAFNGY